MALIDKETIRKEIEQLRDEYTDIAIDSHYGTVNANHVVDDLEQLLSFLDPLQESAKRGYKDCNGCEYNRTVKDQIGWQFHGCFGGEYKGKPIAEIELCPLKVAALTEQPEEGLDVTDFCKPIDPGIAQCVADHWWKMIGEESTNKKPVEGLEEEIATWIPAHISGGDDEVWKDTKNAVTEWAGIVARHFAEWGIEEGERQMIENARA